MSTSLLLFALLQTDGFFTAPALYPAPTAEERKLHRYINEYRRQHRKPPIPLCKSLSKVAHIHVRDLHANPPVKPCNMHSWSKSPKWKGCCYTRDHRRARCMWTKPRELTRYRAYGYENSHRAYPRATADTAIRGWKRSKHHNAVLLNQGMWRRRQWRCIGVGIYQRYAVIWFGWKADPAGNWVK